MQKVGTSSFFLTEKQQGCSRLSNLVHSLHMLLPYSCRTTEYMIHQVIYPYDTYMHADGTKENKHKYI
jgi:hypothetical protein